MSLIVQYKDEITSNASISIRKVKINDNKYRLDMYSCGNFNGTYKEYTSESAINTDYNKIITAMKAGYLDLDNL